MTEVEVAPIPSTSWPKEFPELKELDDLLKCSICYEYMQTTLISACSHSFCSICIRRYLQYQNQCPTCFSQLFDNQLRNNRTLDAVVQVYTKVKDKLCHHLRISAVVIPSTSSTSKDNAVSSPSTSSRREEPTKILVKADVSQSKDAHSTRPKKRVEPEKSIKTPKRTVNKNLDEIEIIEPDVRESPRQVSNVPSTPVCLASPSVSKIRVPDMFTTSPKSYGPSSSHETQATVPCPVCSVDIPEANINLHLDKCLLRASGQQPAPPKIENKMKRLPKLVYTLLSDKDLKKKAKEYGLNVLGDRKTLISRLKRYTVAYNSECDKAVPKSLIEILHDVEKEEKLEQRANAQIEKPTALFNTITRSTDPKVINEVNEKYIKENESTFKALIQKMKDREGTNIRPTGHVNRIFDDVDVDMFESGDDCVEVDAEPRDMNKTVNEPQDMNRTRVESNHTPKRSSSSRLPNQLFNGEKASSPSSPIVALKRLPDHKLPGSSLSTLNQNFISNDEVDEPEDEPDNTLNQSNQSFSLLDESQLDFPIDSEPNLKTSNNELLLRTPGGSEEDDSASSVELFVSSSSRQRKRKEMASSPAPSNNIVTRKLRKRVDR
nr:PREDICTED: E3 ubiquitin-protein ligase RAD18-like [Bemisia tabaci]